MFDMICFRLVRASKLQMPSKEAPAWATFPEPLH